MIKFIYTKIFIEIANLLFSFYSKFSQKARERESNWVNFLSVIPPKKGIRILVHSSSMGEFEQAKPVIEEIYKVIPDIEFVASFFSPSGLLNQNKYELIDYAVYLPIDTEKNAKLFVNAIKPDIAIFVRYDLWFNVLSQLEQLGTKSYLICATKPSSRIISLFSGIKAYLNICYNSFHTIFTVGENHTDFISNIIGFNRSILTLSDTRADRIINNVMENKLNKILPDQLLENSITLIAGSSWEKDEEIISESINEINKNGFICRVIYVPHEPTERNLERIEKLHPKVIRLSSLLNDLSVFDIEVMRHKLLEYHLLVDSIGNLLKLYATADIAYVGCGFGDGVHSVSEPAGYSIPIVCGPNIQKMPDAVELNKRNALKIINNSNELKNWLIKMITDQDIRQKVGKLANDYIVSSAGSSKIIADEIVKSIE